MLNKEKLFTTSNLIRHKALFILASTRATSEESLNVYEQSIATADGELERVDRPPWRSS